MSSIRATLVLCIVAVAFGFAPIGRFAARSSLKMANIVETAVGAGTFKTLVAAVTAAGLAPTLSGPGPFTVFAPTDEAFAKLPAGTVEALLKDIPKLTDILTFHVVSGLQRPTRNGRTYDTLNPKDGGKELSVKVDLTSQSFIWGGQDTPAKVCLPCYLPLVPNTTLRDDCSFSSSHLTLLPYLF